jgi:hypothetical protein
MVMPFAVALKRVHVLLLDLMVASTQLGLAEQV